MTQQYIPLSIPQINGNEWKYVKECLDTGWVSSVGPFVGRFEEAVAAYLGVEDAVAVSTGTAALHTALLIAGVNAGEEVIVPALTFVAPVNAICYVGASPIFMDVSEQSWGLDVEKLASFLNENCEVRGETCFNKNTNKKIRAIVVVHILGLCCNMDPITHLAKQYYLKIIEDAAEGMGVCYKGKPIGTFGDLGAFSFNGNKVVTAGGGGMIVAKKEKDLAYARYLTTQAKDDPLEYIHNEIGYNYRLTNIQAAVGLAQMEQLQNFLQKKKQIALYYEESFKNLEGITLMPMPDFCKPTYWLYAILLRKQVTVQERKMFIQKLNEEGVGARSFWHPIYKLTPFQQFETYKIENTMPLYERGICLPSSVGMKMEDLERVVRSVKNVLLY